MNPLALLLVLSSVLFALGLLAVLTRRNAILVLVGVELMLNAANINFIAFWRYGPAPAEGHGVVFVVFALAVAAAEAAVGLALVIALHRHQRNVRLGDARRLHG